MSFPCPDLKEGKRKKKKPLTLWVRNWQTAGSHASRIFGMEEDSVKCCSCMQASFKLNDTLIAAGGQVGTPPVCPLLLHQSLLFSLLTTTTISMTMFITMTVTMMTTTVMNTIKIKHYWKMITKKCFQSKLDILFSCLSKGFFLYPLPLSVNLLSI